MTNHPNRAKRYILNIESWSNAGLGWERTPDDDQCDPRAPLTRTEIEAVANSRDANSTSLSVLPNSDCADEPVACAPRGNKNVTWF